MAAETVNNFMSPSVEVMSKVGKSKHHEQKGGDNPEGRLITALNGRDGAHFSRLALGWRPINALPSEPERDQSHADRERPKRLERLKIRNPRSAYAHPYQQQRS